MMTVLLMHVVGSLWDIKLCIRMWYEYCVQLTVIHPHIQSTACRTVKNANYSDLYILLRLRAWIVSAGVWVDSTEVRPSEAVHLAFTWQQRVYVYNCAKAYFMPWF
jgi:hypothetical protein